MNWFWQTVLSNSAVASGLAAVALLVGRSPRRAATAHLIWLSVLIKLLTPPLFVCEWPTPVPHAAPASPVVGDESLPGSTSRPAGPRGPGEPAPSLPSITGVVPTNWSPAPIVERRPGPRPWGAIVGWAWATLASGLALVAAIRLAKFRRRLRSFPTASGEIRAIAAELAAAMGPMRVPEVRVAPGILPPLVWSLGGPPIVVLPARLVERWGPDEVGAVLAHELAHIRRGDHLVRYLELACTIALPWHPLVWLAARRLRDLEERCCDAWALEVRPDRPRAYALALVATLEFLSGRRVPAVPLRTAIRPAHPLARRIAMLGQTPPRRLTTPGLALVAGLVAAPLALTFAQAPAPTPASPPAPTGRPAEPVLRPVVAPGEPAVVRGRVVDKAGAPVADARVRLAIPAAEMRFADVTIGAPNPLPRVQFREVRTDAEGHYEFRLPDLAGQAKASFDVLKPGFRRLSGTLASGGDARSVAVEPGQTLDVPLTLSEPGRSVRGVVVDEAGRPVGGVEIGAYFASGGASYGIERTSTRPDGTFEIFNIAPEPHQWHTLKGTNIIHIEHPGYLTHRIEDLDAGRDDLRIVLKAGRSIGGTVLDDAGRPVAGAVVVAQSPTPLGMMPCDRGATTDAAGRFALRGLPETATQVRAYAYPIKQQVIVPMPADATQEFQVRLRPMAMPADLKTYDVLGMKLVDVTPELQKLYGLFFPKGAMILDPGANHARLGVGELAEGYSFWMVGDHRGESRVGDVRDFVGRVLAESRKEEAGKIGVRVVYSFATPETVGNNTQYLKLTPDDLRELQALADRLAK